MRSRTRRAQLKAAALIFAALLGLTSAVVYASTDRPRPSLPNQEYHAGSAAPSPTLPTRSGSSSEPAGVDPFDLQQHLDRMRHLMLPNAVTSQPRITGEATTQPDLYAAEFVRRLLTQDYARPRASYLAWVQAESTAVADPLVVALVPPDLRDRFAVYSLTDTGDGMVPVPPEREWAELAAAHATTTVLIDRVVEPAAWANAVQAGRITDPGTTARLVAATVTRHAGTGGHSRSEAFSVALSLNLEGPPTRADWRFVAAVTYTIIPAGGAS